MGWTTMNHKEILIVKFRVYEYWVVLSWTNSQLSYRDKYFNQTYSNHLNNKNKNMYKFQFILRIYEAFYQIQHPSSDMNLLKGTKVTQLAST